MSLARRVFPFAAAAIMAMVAAPAAAVVNPNLQPLVHLFPRYKTVIACCVAKVDEQGRKTELDVTRVCKGQFAPKKVTLGAKDAQDDAAFLTLGPGQQLVAYVGTARKRHESDILVYVGGGKWHDAQWASAENAADWKWIGDADRDTPPDSPDIMFGTFNGDAERLAEMMADAALGRAYFPAEPFAQFHAGVPIAKFEKPVRGVALYDVDGNDRLDIYASCESGNRLFLQDRAGRFVDCTDALGLSGVKGVSCSFADVDADGRADLLVDGAIYLRQADGTFKISGLLPTAARQDVLSSAFVDLNGDGYPDAVVSRNGKGLCAYLDPGPKGGPFADATAKLGLDRIEEGKGTGYFEPGDFNGDGHADLFYGVDKGMLLIQGKDGKFEPLDLPEDEANAWSTEGRQAAAPKPSSAACGPIWREDGLGFCLPLRRSYRIIASVDGMPKDVTRYGNETSEGLNGPIMTLAEDLDADGTVDLYTSSRLDSEGSLFLMNRNYGSFMFAEKYAGRAKMFPSDAHRRGALGLAAGDVNGDGANDLLIGGIDGSLVLLLNATLESRKPQENSKYHEQKRLQTKIVTVAVKGRTGVVGATVKLADKNGRIVALRQIGCNVGTGCRGPDAVNLAVREPGTYELTVRFSDGTSCKGSVDLSAASPVHSKVVADREKTPGINQIGSPR